MKKQFLCVWTGNYKDQYYIVDEEFFTEEKGYSEDDIRRLQIMSNGICLVAEFGSHYIIRLSDKE